MIDFTDDRYRLRLPAYDELVPRFNRNVKRLFSSQNSIQLYNHSPDRFGFADPIKQKPCFSKGRLLIDAELLSLCNY